jgi:hypothetical protein
MTFDTSIIQFMGVFVFKGKRLPDCTSDNRGLGAFTE